MSFNLERLIFGTAKETMLFYNFDKDNTITKKKIICAFNN